MLCGYIIAQVRANVNAENHDFRKIFIFNICQEKLIPNLFELKPACLARKPGDGRTPEGDIRGNKEG
nr:MAG TPA: hypothetical protein [Caudoviricetes sp.]